MRPPLWRHLLGPCFASMVGLASASSDDAIYVIDDDDRRDPPELADGATTASAVACVAMPSPGPDVGLISLSGPLNQQAADALGDLLQSCWLRGDLKVQVEHDDVDVLHLVKVVEARGFVFSKVRRRPGLTPVAEFYADLYVRRDEPALRVRAVSA